MACWLFKRSIQEQERLRNPCEHDRRVSQAFDSPLQLSDVPQEIPRTTDTYANFDPAIPCSTCQGEKRALDQYRWKLIAGLCLPFSVQALDATIIAGALPFIASDFQQLSQLNWIISAFNLTSAIFIPVWGQLADVFGRYAALQSASILMMVGSGMCAGAPVSAFGMLLIGRALQGIGCAGILILTKVILADKVSLKENAKNNTVFTVVAGVGYGIGPVIGGYLTQANWSSWPACRMLIASRTVPSWPACRKCPLLAAGNPLGAVSAAFIIFSLHLPLKPNPLKELGLLGLLWNLDPVGFSAIGVVLLHFVLRPELLGSQTITRYDGAPTPHDVRSTFMTKLSTIDFGGQLLLLFGMGLLVLSLTWAGSSYSWSDVRVVAPLVMGCFLTITFFVWEHFMLPGSKLSLRYPYRKAMMPLDLLITRNAGLLIYINFVTGMAMYAVFYFVDLYFALVLNYTPGEAGQNLIYYMPGLGVGAYLAVRCCNFYPRQTWLPLALGTIVEPLGVTMLAVALNAGNLPTIYGMLALTGVGTGIRFMPGTLHGVGYYPKHIASVVSLMSLAISLGGTIATTIMINIFNNSMAKAGLSFSSTTSSSFDAISSFSPSEQAYFKENSQSSIALSFFAISAFLWLGVPAVAGLGNVDLSKDGKQIEGDGDEACDGTVKRGSYIGSLLKRYRGGPEKPTR